ncbi:MAG: DNA polymerase III subunit delta [Tannerella sp.]|jgi:DNA polymerase-3 subunit delta'|nr:DNA polymerase III subunit delta [Tannerella sp.]
MFFRDVIGQDSSKQYLREAARSGRVPHAQMFCGDDGAGTFQLAMAYARYLNCTARTDTDSCGKCPSCIKYNELAHPDLHFVFPMIADKKKKRETCDDVLADWRSFLKKQIRERAYFNIDTWLGFLEADNKQALIYSAESDRIIHKMNLRIYEAAYRVLFIWMPERMHPTCANKLLKIIEEPAANTAILMVTGNHNMVLGTICSRSQPFEVRQIEPEALVSRLVEAFRIDEADARRITHLSQGSYLKATELLTVENDDKFYLGCFKLLMRNGWSKDITAMKAFADNMATLTRERQKSFLSYSQRLVRENFVLCLGEPALNYLNGEEADFSKNFSPYINERNIVDIMNELALGEEHVGRNVNSKMVFFDLSMRMTSLVRGRNR